MPAGRPTSYNEEIYDRAVAYLEGEYEEDEVTPTIAGLSLFLGITRSTVYQWAKDDQKPEFSYIVEQLMAAQEKSLVKNGLTGDFNASITKLALTKHGYSDKQETQHGGNIGVTDLTDDQLNYRLQELINAAAESQ